MPGLSLGYSNLILLGVKEDDIGNRSEFLVELLFNRLEYGLFGIKEPVVGIGSSSALA